MDSAVDVHTSGAFSSLDRPQVTSVFGLHRQINFQLKDCLESEDFSNTHCHQQGHDILVAGGPCYLVDLLLCLVILAVSQALLQVFHSASARCSPHVLG